MRISCGCSDPGTAKAPQCLEAKMEALWIAPRDAPHDGLMVTSKSKGNPVLFYKLYTSGMLVSFHWTYGALLPRSRTHGNTLNGPVASVDELLTTARNNTSEE